MQCGPPIGTGSLHRGETPAMLAAVRGFKMFVVKVAQVVPITLIRVTLSMVQGFSSRVVKLLTMVRAGRIVDSRVDIARVGAT